MSGFRFTQHSNRRASVPASLTYENGELVFRFPYDVTLKEAMKAAIPSTERSWDGEHKCWRIAATKLNVERLIDVTKWHLGIDLSVPTMPQHTAKPEVRILDVRYIGQTKDRGDGERSAFGWHNGGWNVVFPEPVLRAWFGLDQQRPEEAPTLYGVLGLKQQTADSEIKKAYRRLALQWHPDRCSEPDAKEVFIKIQHAYEVLSDASTRARYDAGLALEAGLQVRQVTKWKLGDLIQAPQTDGYRSPLRCGQIMCTGVETLGRFVVSEIHGWEDIVDRAGRVLVTSWPAGAKTFEEQWT